MPSALSSLAHLAEPNRGGHPDVFWEEYAWIIRDAIQNDARSLQTQIGPSEIGLECTHCLALKIAQVEEVRDPDDEWLATVGKAFHKWLETTFTAYNEQFSAGAARFLTELRVEVGEVGGQVISGSCDLYDRNEASITDWKLVGITTLREVRRLKETGDTKGVYRKQGHLYGRGAVARGLPVERIRVAYLPRNGRFGLREAVIFDEPYDEGIALAALDRANAIADTTAAIGLKAFTDIAPRAAGCYSCPRYPDSDGNVPSAGTGHRSRAEALSGLIAPNPVVA